LKYNIQTNPRLIEADKWSDFVQSHPDGNIFQTPEFVSFISEIPQYFPVVIGALREDGSIAGILCGVLQKENGFIKRLFSSRLIVWGGPVTAGHDQQVADLLLRELISRYAGKCIYMEFRNLFAMNGIKDTFQNKGFQFSDHLNYIIPTTEKDQTTRQISSGKTRQIKKSLKNGARILEEVSIEQVRQFYQILVTLYKTKVGKPLPTWEFFERFYYHPELGRYLLIESGGAIIGGIMCPVYKNETIYEWYVAGEDGRHEGIYPSILATWAPINYALEKGIKQFDFMGAGKPGADYGVREFKSTFGGELVSFGRYNRINNQLLYFIGKTGLAILNRLQS
jgi:hypothetical protein